MSKAPVRRSLGKTLHSFQGLDAWGREDRFADGDGEACMCSFCLFQYSGSFGTGNYEYEVGFVDVCISGIIASTQFACVLVTIPGASNGCPMEIPK